MQAVLCDHGVDVGRAHKLASNHLLTPAMVRNSIAKVEARLASINNVGGYLGSLLEEEITTARAVEREHEAQASEGDRQRLLDADASIDTMTDAQLQEALDRRKGTFPGLSPADLRSAPALRREMARDLSKRVEPVAGVPT